MNIEITPEESALIDEALEDLAGQRGPGEDMADAVEASELPDALKEPLAKAARAAGQSRKLKSLAVMRLRLKLAEAALRPPGEFSVVPMPPENPAPGAEK